jgi:co-chaperonin GroES (HSP10)
MDNIQMKSDIVLVEPLDEILEESLLVLVPGADERTRLGIVKHCGPGRKNKKTGMRQPIYVQPGDKVLLGAYTGEELYIPLNGVDLIAVREPDIMAIVA